MRAVTIRAFGDPDGMDVVDRPAPAPAPGEVVIRTEAIGVGGVDAVIRRGSLGGHGFPEGMIPGSEVAGIIIAVAKAWIVPGSAAGSGRLRAQTAGTSRKP